MPPLLTLEEIRAGLRVQQQQQQPRKAAAAVSSAETPLELAKQFRVATELVEIVRHLILLQSEKAVEWGEKTVIVRQFEDLYDAVRLREVQLPQKVREQQEKFLLRKAKCDNLTRRAEKHLVAGQTDRDRVALDAATVKQKVDFLRDELSQLQQLSEEQQTELEVARAQAEKIPSERELMELHLKLRRLRNDNAQLLTDNEELRNAVDDLVGSHKAPRAATYLPRVSAPTNAHLKDSIAQLEKQIAHINAQAESERENLANELRVLHSRRAELENYVSSLEAMLAR